MKHRQTRLIMGMPITIEIADEVNNEIFKDIFAYFTDIDERFSPFKSTSEVSAINQGLPEPQWSRDMQTILRLSQQTKRETDGYFDVWRNGKLDPSGMVKGWSIHQAARRLLKAGLRNFSVEAGGDVEVHGRPEPGRKWQIGIRNPFNDQEIIKTVSLSTGGVATSGTYVRGQHIYNPHSHVATSNSIVSMTVIAANVYEADRFATAAFAMGPQGIDFIESRADLEGYMIDQNKIATFTSGFETYA